MNEYDKAGRYLVKRDPPGFFRWCLCRREVPFQAWIDARRQALPDQGDLANDLVAAFDAGGGFEALCVELQAASEEGSAARLLPAPGPPDVDVRRAGAVPGGMARRVGGLGRD